MLDSEYRFPKLDVKLELDKVVRRDIKKLYFARDARQIP